MDEEDPERIVPVGRSAGERTVSAPATTLGPTLAQAAVTRQHSHPVSHATATNVPPSSAMPIPTTTTKLNRDRNMSRKEMVKAASDNSKKYMKKETKEFFGLDEDSENVQRIRWEEKRKRLAARKYGQLKDQPHTTHHTQSFTTADFQALSEPSTPAVSISDKSKLDRTKSLPVKSKPWPMLSIETKIKDPPQIPDTSTLSEGATASLAESDDVLEEYGASAAGLSDSVDAGGTTVPRLPHRGKDSVAKMTWDGLSYVVSTVAKRRAKSQISGTAGGRSKSRSYAPSSMSAASDLLYSDEPDVSPTTTATTTTTTTTAPTRRSTPPNDYAMESLSDESKSPELAEASAKTVPLADIDELDIGELEPLKSDVTVVEISKPPTAREEAEALPKPAWPQLVAVAQVKAKTECKTTKKWPTKPKVVCKLINAIKRIMKRD